MIQQYLTFGIAAGFISWIVGILITPLIIQTSYFSKLENLNFLKDEQLNKLIGMDLFQWIVTHSFFKFFNQKIKLEGKKTDLLQLRKEMCVAEIGHLVAFVFLLPLAVYQALKVGVMAAMLLMGINILMNLYPSLLQQRHKRRLDPLIKRQLDHSLPETLYGPKNSDT